MKRSVALVLEGGGMRGVYSSGVLDVLLEGGIEVPYCIGVSAGACNITSYVSKQPQRSYHVNIDYVNDKRYISWRNWLHDGSIFNMKMLFETMPNELVPFDFDTYAANPVKVVVGTTDCVSGEEIYFEEQDISGPQGCIHFQASSSIPLLSQPVTLGEHVLMDGGISAPVPIDKAFEDGNEKAIVILTQPVGYRKAQSKSLPIIKLVYGKQYRGLVEAMKIRHIVYNRQQAYLEQLQHEGKVLILRPSRVMPINLLERNKGKLEDLYRLGVEDTTARLDEVREFVS